MLDITDLYREETYLQLNQDVILSQSATWTNVASKVLQGDGSFADGSNATQTINLVIEPIKTSGQEKFRKLQGIVENTSHTMFTLKNYDIQDQDLITQNGITYRVVYKIPDQYSIDFAEYLLAVEE